MLSSCDKLCTSPSSPTRATIKCACGIMILRGATLTIWGPLPKRLSMAKATQFWPDMAKTEPPFSVVGSCCCCACTDVRSTGKRKDTTRHFIMVVAAFLCSDFRFETLETRVKKNYQKLSVISGPNLKSGKILRQFSLWREQA